MRVDASVLIVSPACDSTGMILIAAALYLAAARHEFCAPAKFQIWHSHIWRGHGTWYLVPGT